MAFRKPLLSEGCTLIALLKPMAEFDTLLFLRNHLLSLLFLQLL